MNQTRENHRKFIAIIRPRKDTIIVGNQINLYYLLGYSQKENHGLHSTSRGSVDLFSSLPSLGPTLPLTSHPHDNCSTSNALATADHDELD
jgi:hypothetical protein